MVYKFICPTRLLCALTLMLMGASTAAETVQWRGYDIHYTTFSSTLIPQEVANAHGIVRAKNRIVTNISIRKSDQPVKAKISGTNSNLLNQLFTMHFVQVTEETAVYYLTNQLIDEKDHLRFNISITPEGEEEAYELRFTRQY